MIRNRSASRRAVPPGTPLRPLNPRHGAFLAVLLPGASARGPGLVYHSDLVSKRGWGGWGAQRRKVSRSVHVWRSIVSATKCFRNEMSSRRVASRQKVLRRNVRRRNVWRRKPDARRRCSFVQRYRRFDQRHC